MNIPPPCSQEELLEAMYGPGAGLITAEELLNSANAIAVIKENIITQNVVEKIEQL